MISFVFLYFRFSVDEAGKKTESQTRTSGSNREKGWNKWWRATLSTDDYLKFIASKVKHNVLFRLYLFQVYLLFRALTI